MKKIFAGLFFIAGTIVFFASCNDGIDYEKLRREELAILQEYIDQEHPGAEPTSSGLYYFNEEGTGVLEDSIKPGDQVQIFYAIWGLEKNSEGVLDSFPVSESSGYTEGYRYEPMSFIVGSGTTGLTGLEEAVTYMHPGTHSHLVINSELAYGQRGDGAYVGMFQTLLMEVEVYKVIPLETPEE